MKKPITKFLELQEGTIQESKTDEGERAYKLASLFKKHGGLLLRDITGANRITYLVKFKTIPSAVLKAATKLGLKELFRDPIHDYYHFIF